MKSCLKEIIEKEKITEKIARAFGDSRKIILFWDLILERDYIKI